MKKLFLNSLLLFFAVYSFAQIKNPVAWKTIAKKIDALTYEVHLTATIEKGWHTYSQTTPKGGPVATSVTFVKNPLLTISGGLKESGKLEQHHEELFGVDVKQFSNRVDFIQLVKLKAGVKTNVAGTIEFMVCNDKECLPPRKEAFSIALQ